MWGNSDAEHAQRLGQQGLAFAPPHDWVIERPLPARPSEAEGAVRFLLNDTQVDLRGDPVFTWRQVSQAVHPDGVPTVGAFNPSFNPAFERLIVHRIRVTRGERATDMDGLDGFQLLRRESSLDRRIYDGSLTADLQIPDVRTGDIVETWYSIVGANPALKGAHSGRFTFGWSSPVSETWVRILASAERKLDYATLPDGWMGPAYSETRKPDFVDRQWVGRNVPAFRYENHTPSFWIGHASLLVRDELDWSAIADIFREHYVSADPLPAELEEEAVRILREHASPGARAVAALRLVQREVRYVAMGMGTGGFLPRAVDDIWSRRFGDCKDVSRLLTALLLRLSVDATPALTSTDAGERIANEGPNVYAFNHCIVRVRIEGGVWWLDATAPEQGGDLDHLLSPPFAWALPLEASAALEPIEQPAEPPLVQETSEIFQFGPKPDSPCRLEVTTVFHAWKADEMRAAVRREGIAEIEKHWQAWYTGSYGRALRVRPLGVADDLDNNILTFTETYDLHDAWSRGADGTAWFGTSEDSIRADLPVLPSPARTQPFALGRPRRIRRSSVLRTPTPWPKQTDITEANAPGLQAFVNRTCEGRSSITLTADYAITRSWIEARDVPAFSASIDKLYPSLGVRLDTMVYKDAFSGSDAVSRAAARVPEWLVVLLTIAGLAALSFFLDGAGAR